MVRWSVAVAAATLMFVAVMQVPVHAATTFLPLGVDAAGDSQEPSGKAPGTLKATDILSAGIATVGTELQFHMALRANSELAGSYCWAMGFNKGTTEMFPVICAEFAGGTLVGQVGWTTQTSSSRGAQVTSASGEFVAGGIVIHIPLSDAGLKIGDTISDIYGLTYVSRALTLSDVIPDAKSDKTSPDSLGSYQIGATALGTGAPAPVAVARTIFINETGQSVNLRFAPLNATTQAYRYNWTRGPAALHVRADAAPLNGTAFVVVRDAAGKTIVNQTFASKITLDRNVTGAAGTWQIVLDFTGYKGNFTMSLRSPDAAPSRTSTNQGATTSGGSSGASGSTGTNATSTSSTTKGSPLSLWAPAVAVVAALVMRRRLR